MKIRDVFAAALVTTLLCAPLNARADLVIPREANPCDGKKAGDACGVGSVCQQGTCCTQRHVSATIQHYESQKPLDQQDPNIINPPETCSPCLKCEAAAQPDAAPDLAPPALDAAPDATADAGSPAPAVPSTPAAAPPANKGGMCASAPWSSEAGAGSLLLGALLCAGLVRRRAR
jgi:hypothetical protein